MAPTHSPEEGEPLPLRMSLYRPSVADRRIPGAEIVPAVLFMGFWLGALLLFACTYLTSAGAGGYVYIGALFLGLLAFIAYLVVLAFRGVDTHLAAAKAVVVCADGLVLQRSLGRRELLPYREIVAVKAAPGAVLLNIRNCHDTRGKRGARGEREIVLPVLDARRRRELAGHIQRARDAASAAANLPQAALDALDRGARSRAQWVEHLCALARRPHGYREGTLDQETLARIVESGGAPPDRRVAAAFALASTGDPAFRRRIRVAAAASGDARLRVVLERAAEQDLDAEALDAEVLEARPERPPARAER